MEITEVRIKLMSQGNDKLRAFCSITIDNDFVVRDLKVIEGARGPFVAMPSRKLTERCPRCKGKNHYRASYCNDCGTRLFHEFPDDHDSARHSHDSARHSHDSARHSRDSARYSDEPARYSHDPARSSHDPARSSHDPAGGSQDPPRLKLHADIAHPINSRCREVVQARILEEYRAELERAKDPDYRPADLDVFDEDYLTEETGELALMGDEARPGNGPAAFERPARPDGGLSHDPAGSPQDSAGHYSRDPAGRSHHPGHPHPAAAHGPRGDASRGRRPGHPGGPRRQGDRRPGGGFSGGGSRDRARGGGGGGARGRDGRGGRPHRGDSGGAPRDFAQESGRHRFDTGPSHEPGRYSHDPARHSHDPARHSHDSARHSHDSAPYLHDAPRSPRFPDPVPGSVQEPKKIPRESESESEDNFGVGLFS